MNEELKMELEQFANNVKGGMVSQRDFEAKYKALNEKIDALPKGEEVKELRDALKSQGEMLAMMKNYGGRDTLSLDAQIKAFVENKANIEVVKKKQAAGTDIKVKAAALMTTTNAKPAIDLWNVEIDRTIHSAPTEADAIYPRLIKGSTASPTIAWVNRVDGEGGAAFIEEGTLKPLKDWSYESATSTAKKVVVASKVSTEMLEDAPYMTSEINQLLRQDLMSKVNEKLLTGTGTGAEIKGITVDAAGYTISDLNGKISMPNYADVIRAAVLQMRTLNFRPDTLFINPVDNAIIDLTKDTSGHYLSMEMQALMRGIALIETANIPKGKFLLMDSTRWMVRVYENLRLEYGWEDNDFRKNIVTVIAEMRLHSYQNSIDAGSIVYADFATVQAALETSSAAAA